MLNKIFLISYFATVIPATSIAVGAIQSARSVIVSPINATDEESNKIEMQISNLLENADAYTVEKGKVTFYNGKTPLAVFEVK